MKKRRNLSGIYFLHEDSETGEWGNICFEDLPLDTQMNYMKCNSREWVEGLAVKLADTLNIIGEQFNLEAV
jgi:hypothetical protein